MYTNDAMVAETFCGGCGYNLRGLGSDRCPECGLTIDPNRGGFIPWERRADLGRVRSFVLTVLLATIRPARLATACGSPVDVRSARWFRRWVIALAWLPLVGLFVFVLCTYGKDKSLHGLDLLPNTPLGPNSYWEPIVIWLAGATIYPVLPISALMTLSLGTAISHWFSVRRLPMVRQNRAMAISYYQCAPLVFTAVPVSAIALFLKLTAVDDTSAEPLNTYIIVTGYTALIGSIFMTILLWINPLRSLHKTTQCGFGRVVVVGCGLLVQWAVAIAAGLGLFTAAVGFVWLMIDSLRR